MVNVKVVICYAWFQLEPALVSFFTLFGGSRKHTGEEERKGKRKVNTPIIRNIKEKSLNNNDNHPNINQVPFLMLFCIFCAFFFAWSFIDLYIFPLFISLSIVSGPFPPPNTEASFFRGQFFVLVVFWLPKHAT